MTRIPGRSAWLAWPAGLLCAAVVAAIAWLALPMVPVAAAWVGDALRAGSSDPVAAPEGAVRPPVLETAQSDADLDCRRLYPVDLWTELTWSPRALLLQDMSAPPTAVASLADALAPQVRVTCRWRFYDGATAVSTVARVPADAAPVARAKLQAAGFSCAEADPALTCARTQGDVVEEHAFGGDLWLVSVTSGSVPEAYGSRLAAGLWGD